MAAAAFISEKIAEIAANLYGYRAFAAPLQMNLVPVIQGWWPLEEKLVARCGSPLHLFEPEERSEDGLSHEPFPGWMPEELSLLAPGVGTPIYTFESQFTPDEQPGLFDDAPPSVAAAADVEFLRGLDLEGLECSLGARSAPLRRLMITPATIAAAGSDGGGRYPAYDENNLPTPATLVADIKAVNFRSAITDLNDDGGGHPLPYLSSERTAVDEVHEDEDNQYMFCTPKDAAEVNAGEEEEIPGYDHGAFVSQSRAQLAALKHYALNRRVYFIVVHTKRFVDGEFFPDGVSTDVLLMALGVSAATGNLVGVIAIQVSKNLCD
eukprot:g4234.t1